MSSNNNNFDDWDDDRLNRMEDVLRGWGGRDFVGLEGETNLPPDLEFAVSTLVRLRYRGFDVWRVNRTYSFASEGIKVRTSVEAYLKSVELTAEEAILIATDLVRKHMNQSDESQG